MIPPVRLTLGPMLESHPVLDGWVTFCTVVIVIFSWLLVLICFLGCRAFHATMADNENSQHILLNIAYEQFAVMLQVLSLLLALKVSHLYVQI